MAILPRNVEELIQFCENHQPVWQNAGTQIGITPAQLLAFGDAVGEARAAFDAKTASRQADRDATVALRSEAGQVRQVAAQLLASIKAFAENQPDPTVVYVAAQIPPPASPKPIPPPGLPADFRVGLDQEGNVLLAWKCANPPGAAGTVYIVERRSGTSGPFSYLGATGERRFLDETVPGGGPVLDYRVFGQRAGKSGPAAIWTVRFGQGGGGLTITESFGGPEVAAKLAA
ncbi:MAG: hypothetical protein WD749_02155 [Phycisphaerales bacterium]